MSDETRSSMQDQLMASWDGAEYLFADLFARCAYKNQVLEFLKQLRRAGYGRKLRAGPSLDMFIVSRSRRHGLRPDQAAVVFRFHDGRAGAERGRMDSRPGSCAIAPSRDDPYRIAKPSSRLTPET